MNLSKLHLSALLSLLTLLEFSSYSQKILQLTLQTLRASSDCRSGSPSVLALLTYSVPFRPAGGWFTLCYLIWDLIDSHFIDKLVKFPKKQSRILGETNNAQMLLEIVIKKKFLCYEDLPGNQKTVSKHMYLLYIIRLLCIIEICKSWLLRRN